MFIWDEFWVILKVCNTAPSFSQMSRRQQNSYTLLHATSFYFYSNKFLVLPIFSYIFFVVKNHIILPYLLYQQSCLGIFCIEQSTQHLVRKRSGAIYLICTQTLWRHTPICRHTLLVSHALARSLLLSIFLSLSPTPSLSLSLSYSLSYSLSLSPSLSLSQLDFL